jgi:hypothetical protein
VCECAGAAENYITPSCAVWCARDDMIQTMNVLRLVLAASSLAYFVAAWGCDFPDEGGMPLRRAVTRIEMLPEVHEWHRSMVEKGSKPQYVVRLDEPVRASGKCYWPVEVRADGKLWRRYLISPDGKSIRPHD